MDIIKRAPVVVNPLYKHGSELRESLSGDWNFRLDPDNVGKEQKWFELPFIFQDHIKVPGCWQGQGFGGDGTEFHKEFFTEIRPFRATYEGTGWYSKTFYLPKNYKGKRVWLNFGGSNPTKEVWLNGTKLGSNHLPFLPFGFEITDVVSFDSINHLALRVSEEDRLLGMTYYYCGKWSGLYRDVELVATGENYIDSLYVYPNAKNGEVVVKAAFGGDISEDMRFNIDISFNQKTMISEDIAVSGKNLEYKFVLDEYKCWSPDTPSLYRINAQLCVEKNVSDCRCERFGFVSLETDKKHILINSEPYYMRGTGDFGEDVKNGSPNTDRDYWYKSLTALRKMGYNYVRCQSFVPTPEYFDMADEVGLLVQSEMGVLGPIAGNSMYHTYNMWPKPTPDYREDFRKQWNAIVKRDTNHPSANIYCMSNELKTTYFPQTAWRCYNETKAIKPTSFVLWTDGGHRDSFPEELPSDFVNEQASVDKICDKPVVQHEFMWWSSYPDVTIGYKYQNAAMRHFSADLAIKAAIDHGIAHILPQAAKNSQVLQYIEAKGKMEQLRRDNPTLAGVCHFNAMDTGMSSQGLLDIFYERKYVKSDEWLMTNGDTVVLCSLNFDDRVLTSGATFKCQFFVSDFSHPSFISPKLYWSIESDKETIASGEHDYAHAPYMTVPAGEISFVVPNVTKPTKVTLKAAIFEDMRVANNLWDLWIYPSNVEYNDNVYFSKDGEVDENASVIVTNRLTAAALRVAYKGGAVILKGGEGLVRPFNAVLHLEKGRYFFTKPASFPPYEELQSGTIIKEHRMFGDVPHESYADLMFYNMIAESPALDLEPLGLNDADPIIRMLHTYQVCRSLGYIVERRLDKGLVIVTSLCFDDKYPESRYLLSKITEYAASGDWEDAQELTEKTIHALMLGTNIDTDLDFNYKNYKMEDGNENC